MNKKKITLITLGTAFLIAPISIGIVACSNNTNDQPAPEPTNPLDPAFPFATNINAIGNFYTNVIKRYNRNVCNKYYDSPVYQKYHKDYNFRYPGQDFNYKVDNNRYFHNATGQTIDGTNLVYNERVPYLNDIKYNDPNWIISEIKGGTFKKHRAADSFYINKIDNIQAVEQYFSIATGNLGRMNLGLYAPPGEVITLTFDDATWDLIKASNYTDFSITINSNYWDNKPAPNSGEISNRYPFILSDFKININSKDKSIQFGSPFGGNISIYINTPFYTSALDNCNKTSQNLKFTINGAIPCIFYNDGFTTKQDWDNQMKLIANQKLAPVIQCNAPYFSYNIPFSGLNEVHGLYIPDLEFPDVITKKWNDFLFLSNYFAASDIRQYYKKIDMRFCDDIWDNASAFGGGWGFYCPTEWGTSFLINDTMKVFNAYNSWGDFHEINHTFQQDGALFKRNTHPETNQVTIFDLSVIGDIGRYRNELNWTGESYKTNADGWTKLDNAYTAIYDSVNKFDYHDGEYHLYALLNFLMGPINYSGYVRTDTLEHVNTVVGWTGAEEIARLSNYLKINLWPALQNFGRFWRDWPVDYASASAVEKKWIDSIPKEFPAMDFVSNLYSCGSYLYDVDNNNYVYTGDSNTPYEIPAFEPYVFEFDKMSNSMNKEFNWTSLKFNPTTKNGGKLALDKNNPKRLVYTPNPKTDVTDIDEFDISFIPGQWANKPTNYVPEYKFKIKVRQVLNCAIYDTYANILPADTWSNRFNYLEKTTPDKKNALSNFKTIYFPDNKIRGSRIRFKFVAPSNGEYCFYMNYLDRARVIINNDQKQDFFKHDAKEAIEKVWLKKGQVLDFEILLINSNNSSGFDIWATKNDKELKLEENIVNPDVAKYSNISNHAILHDKKYQYKLRQVDNSIYVNNLPSTSNYTNYQTISNMIDIKKYKLSTTCSGPWLNINALNEYNAPYYFELWNQAAGPNHAASSFTVNFNNPEKVQTFCFGHRLDNWLNARPTHIKITATLENNAKEVVYDGAYGQKYNDRSARYSLLVLDKPVTAKSLFIEIDNDKQDGIILWWFRMFASTPTFRLDGPAFPLNMPEFQFSDGWYFERNNDKYNSAINGLFLNSDKPNSTISFKLHRSNGFLLIGTKHPNGAKFEIDINGEKTIVDTTNTDQILNNQILFEQHYNSEQNLTITIKNINSNEIDNNETNNKKLILSYLDSFGPHSYISKVDKK